MRFMDAFEDCFSAGAGARRSLEVPDGALAASRSVKG